MGDHIPAAVDVWDGFEEGEKEGSEEVDKELAGKINHMTLPLVCVGEASSRQKIQKKPASKPGRGRGSSVGLKHQPVIQSVMPLAMYPSFPSASYLAGLGSEEMIPPLRGLNSFTFSAEDTAMSDADSILGKRGQTSRTPWMMSRLKMLFQKEKLQRKESRKRGNMNHWRVGM
jgi:hypothetical protein